MMRSPQIESQSPFEDKYNLEENMKLDFFLSQFADFKQILEQTIPELEYYAAYDPNVINCAIAFAIFKPLEIGMTYFIEYLITLHQSKTC